ncbi:hypothetical protein JK203_09485 [Gluconobacter cerinus]|uniref:Uncharacterized protein n=2 Tax=Gluconobacter cerinus TaxID=38307 RepID=A0AAV5NB49_9PROT|nr:hypothetical protein [Gluconobacter cerinus]MBS1041079.1 hypothetical protein [Gluconobacter cerinus]MBS1047860.1 hypothetical protein [Gluconobacter cerinus]GLQ61521.1 hypothetical protein GCM10007867_03660 [Gluconobacter cerinus]
MTDQRNIDDTEDEIALEATEEGESLLSTIMLPVCIFVGIAILVLLVGLNFI